jgi:hypothetical protein
MVPLILLAILGTLLSLMIGLYYMSRVAEFSYKSTLDSYNRLTEKTSQMLKQDIDDHLRSLQISANLVGQMNNVFEKDGQTISLNRDQIMTILPLIASNKPYLSLAIVGANGDGYNIKGEKVNVSGELYFTKAAKGQLSVSDSLTYTKDNEPVIYYGAPIIKNGNCFGVLIATVSARIDPLNYMDSNGQDEILIYIVNENKDLVGYFKGSNITDFNYKNLVADGYQYENMDNKLSDIGIVDLFNKFSQNKNDYVWYQSPLGINEWTLLVGKNDIMDPVAQETLKISSPGPFARD